MIQLKYGNYTKKIQLNKVEEVVGEIKTFYKNQRELAIAINELIDLYWCNKLNEEHMISCLKKIILNNQNKVIGDTGFRPIIIQRCGKKRLDVISRILKE